MRKCTQDIRPTSKFPFEHKTYTSPGIHFSFNQILASTDTFFCALFLVDKYNHDQKYWYGWFSISLQCVLIIGTDRQIMKLCSSELYHHEKIIVMGFLKAEWNFQCLLGLSNYSSLLKFAKVRYFEIASWLISCWAKVWHHSWSRKWTAIRFCDASITKAWHVGGMEASERLCRSLASRKAWKMTDCQDPPLNTKEIIKTELSIDTWCHIVRPKCIRGLCSVLEGISLTKGIIWWHSRPENI